MVNIRFMDNPTQKHVNASAQGARKVAKKSIRLVNPGLTTFEPENQWKWKFSEVLHSNKNNVHGDQR